jgi:hypothetical protein
VDRLEAARHLEGRILLGVRGARHLTLRLEGGADLRIWPGVEQNHVALKQVFYPHGAPELEEQDLPVSPGLIVAVEPQGYEIPALLPDPPPEPSGDPVLDDHFYGPEKWHAWLNAPKDPPAVFVLEVLILRYSDGGGLRLEATDGAIRVDWSPPLRGHASEGGA